MSRSVLAGAAALVLAAAPAAAQAPPSPCASRPEYRQFDFWAGDWEVVPTGRSEPVVGRSHVELILDRCVVFENWTGARGGEGKSFSLFDRRTGRWHQTWVDRIGTRRDFDGGLDGRIMRMATVQADSMNRITWTNFAPDSVRQTGEYSTDGGRTWSPGYDFMYHRVRAAGAAGS